MLVGSVEHGATPSRNRSIYAAGAKGSKPIKSDSGNTAAIKNPPVVFAKQMNVANGPQQVNNGTAAQVKLGSRLDTPVSSIACASLL